MFMKTLVAYFSHAGENYFGGTLKVIKEGNASIIAKKAQALLSSDIFEIDTIKKYSDKYYECCDQAKLEQQHGELPKLKQYLPSIDGYDKIVLVYPCWWGTMPQAMFTFLNHYDFTGKTIMPICTHEGSGMGSSENDIKNTCPNATVTHGLALQGSYVDSCDAQLKNWLNI